MLLVLLRYYNKIVNTIVNKYVFKINELAKFIFYMCTQNTFITNEIITIAGGE